MFSSGMGTRLIGLCEVRTLNVELGAQSMFHECHCNELKHSGYSLLPGQLWKALAVFPEKKRNST